MVTAVLDHWYVLLGALVLILGPALLMRAWRRGTRPDPGRTRSAVEDMATLAVASAAAYLSSTGLRAFGADVMGLGPIAAWLPFVSLDIAALVCARRARRRADGAEGGGISGVLVWIFIGISAVFSAQEESTLGGILARLIWPVIAGVLYEIGTLERRRAARRAEKLQKGTWVDRRLAAVRLLHPIEWVRVRLLLAGDETLSQEEATRRVRIGRAGVHLHRLHGALEAWAVRRRYREVRAQRAQGRVPVHDLHLAVQEARRLARTTDMARLATRRAGAAEAALETIISRTGDAPESREECTADSSGAEGTCTGTGGCPCPDCTAEDTAQVTPGADVSDAELIRILRGKLQDDGARFATGGQRRTAAALGIGSPRAARVMAEARRLGPLPDETDGSAADASAGAGEESPAEGQEGSETPAGAVPLAKAA